MTSVAHEHRVPRFFSFCAVVEYCAVTKLSARVPERVAGMTELRNRGALASQSRAVTGIEKARLECVGRHITFFSVANRPIGSRPRG